MKTYVQPIGTGTTWQRYSTMFYGDQVLKRVLFITGLVVFILAISIWWSRSLGTVFSFRTTGWIYIATFMAGIIAGIIGAKLKQVHMSQKLETQPGRHSIDSFMEHWGTGVGIFMLIVSGYQIHERGGLHAIKLHFLGLFLTLLFGAYFLADFIVSRKYAILFPNVKDVIDGTIKKYLLRGKVKETGKYLSSQKSSFLLFAILGGLIFISGVIKLIPFYVSFPFRITKIATSIHDVSAILFGVVLAVHILLVIVRRANWPLLISWFNGEIPDTPERK